MDNFYLAALVSEIERSLVGNVISHVALTEEGLRLDFNDGQMLVAHLDPSGPGIHLGCGKRSFDSDRPASHPFLAVLRRVAHKAKVVGVSKDRADRIVRFALEYYDAGGSRARSWLVLLLGGRGANALMTDSDWRIEAALKERKGHEPGSLISPGTEDAGFLKAPESLDPSMNQDEVLAAFFETGPLSSPLLKREFLARSHDWAPVEALKSLLGDLLETPPRPSIYSALPLEEIGDRTIDLKTGLILSHIDLTQARGLQRFEFDSPSAAAERYYAARSAARAFQTDFESVRHSLVLRIRRLEATIRALEEDRARFEDPDRLKRQGDLLLAQLTTATVEGSMARVVDYYDPEQREIRIEVDAALTLQESASRYFSRYQKAKRGLAAVESRLTVVKGKAERLNSLQGALAEARDRQSLARLKVAVSSLFGERASTSTAKQRPGNVRKTARRFVSSDGYEIVVGKKDRDNDYVTFRLARSQDLWLHAADYPGSHVIVRNPNRRAIPLRTIQEAAELAAFYSQAKQQGKAAVHYTEKKFVTKPPRAKPGLVRLSSFKTILVEPRCNLQRIE